MNAIFKNSNRMLMIKRLVAKLTDPVSTDDLSLFPVIFNFNSFNMHSNLSEKRTSLSFRFARVLRILKAGQFNTNYHRLQHE